MRTITLSTKGQLVIPSVRARKALRPGDELELRETAEGILIRKVRRNSGLVKLLLRCPVKGFEIPRIERNLRPPKF